MAPDGNSDIKERMQSTDDGEISVNIKNNFKKLKLSSKYMSIQLKQFIIIK